MYKEYNYQKKKQEKRLVIQGLEEHTNNDFGWRKRKILQTLNNDNSSITEVNRLGKPEKGGERPIQIEVVTVEIKRKLFRKKRCLQGQDIWINKYQPKHVRNKE